MDEHDAPAEEVALAPVAPSRRPLWRRRWATRLAAGLGVLLVAAAVGVATAGDPGDDVATIDRVGEDPADPDRARPGKGARPSTVTEGDGDGDGSSIRNTPGDGSPKKRGEAGKRSRSSRGSGKDSANRKGGWGGGGGGGGSTPTTTPGTTAPPAPAAPAVSTGSLPPLGALAVSAAGPCPAGGTARVELTAAGGTRDGVVVLAADVPVGADGSWSLGPVHLPVAGPVPGVPWALTADRVDATVTCGGARSAATPVALAPVDAAPELEASLEGSTVTARLTSCPTEARLELVAGTTAPTLDDAFTPTATSALEADVDEAGAWEGTASAPDGFDAATQGLWATAACLHDEGGTPVWRYAVVELDAP